MPLHETEQAQLGAVAVAPLLMIGASRSAPLSDAFAQDGAESASDVTVHLGERGAMAVRTR